ncbi:hypothetical protein B0H67DRAFT_339759 [Lasiosphaeris hirsuta]|uniref:Uncharacterized protein n=1 Tax=Lasiosphaeris hirsuta TaxID=260670 RepID=A0AA40DM98_9PEZI|nr:hypothetical protein B0H67DRAFT_339759 [Lasiosphaeris hirsuta]
MLFFPFIQLRAPRLDSPPRPPCIPHIPNTRSSLIPRPLTACVLRRGSEPSRARLSPNPPKPTRTSLPVLRHPRPVDFDPASLCHSLLLARTRQAQHNRASKKKKRTKRPHCTETRREVGGVLDLWWRVTVNGCICIKRVSATSRTHFRGCARGSAKAYFVRFSLFEPPPPRSRFCRGVDPKATNPAFLARLYAPLRKSGILARRRFMCL